VASGVSLVCRDSGRRGLSEDLRPTKAVQRRTFRLSPIWLHLKDFPHGAPYKRDNKRMPICLANLNRSVFNLSQVLCDENLLFVCHVCQSSVLHPMEIKQSPGTRPCRHVDPLFSISHQVNRKCTCNKLQLFILIVSF